MYRAADHRRAGWFLAGVCLTSARYRSPSGTCPVKKVAIGYKSLIITPLKLICLFASLFWRTYDHHNATTFGGWLLGPLAWLLVALLSTTWRCCCISLRYLLRKHFKRSATSTDDTNLMGRFFYYRYRHGYYTLWLTIAFFKRRRCVPKTILSGCLFPYCWQ